MAKPLNISLEVVEGVPGKISAWAEETGVAIPDGVGNEEVVRVSMVVPKASVYKSKNGKSYLSLVAFETNSEYNTHSIKASIPSGLSDKVKGTYQTHPEFNNFFCPFLGNIKKPKDAQAPAQAPCHHFGQALRRQVSGRPQKSRACAKPGGFARRLGVAKMGWTILRDRHGFLIEDWPWASAL